MGWESQDKVENTTSNTTGKDVTNEIEPNEEEVDIFSIEELAPSSIPITIPYFEIYRTNELEYIPYISPYNVGCASASEDSSSSSDSSSENTDTENTGENGSATDSTNTSNTSTQ